MLAGLLAILGVILFLVLYLGGLTLLNGWVLSKLWLWFVVPIFGFKPLTVVQAIGIALVVRFLTADTTTSPKNPDETNAEKFAKILVPYFISIIALGMGYLVKLFL